METFSFFIGIDISKATLDFAIVVANTLFNKFLDILNFVD